MYTLESMDHPRGVTIRGPGLHPVVGFVWRFCWGFLDAGVCPHHVVTHDTSIYWEPLMGMALFPMPPSKAWVLEISLQGQEETKKGKMYLIVRRAV